MDSPDDKARNANEHLGRHFTGGTLVDGCAASHHRHPQQQRCTRQHNNNTGPGKKIQMLGRAMEMMIIQPNDRTQAQNSVNVNETTVD